MGHLLKIKCVDSRVNVHILASKSVPFTLTTMQVLNLALTHMKRITVWNSFCPERFNRGDCRVIQVMLSIEISPFCSPLPTPPHL
jgi:hypothetical protein